MANALYVFALIAFYAVFIDAAASRDSYCNLKACGGPHHTLCKYPALRTSKTCGTIISSTLNADEIQELLDVHNKYRRFVASGKENRGKPGPQPAAKNLGPLKWDQELADIAQTWADQCIYGHEECVKVERFYYGQNIYKFGSTVPLKMTFKEMVSAWYDEVKFFDRNQTEHFSFAPNVSHYTQMMWAETTLLGCGAVRYNPDGFWYTVYLVCNYGPAGNIIGEKMYKTRH